MSNTILLMPSRSRAVALYRDLQDFCATLATYVQEDVGLWMIDEDEWARAIAQSPSIMRLEMMDHHGEPLVGASMSAAPLRGATTASAADAAVVDGDDGCVTLRAMGNCAPGRDPSLRSG